MRRGKKGLKRTFKTRGQDPKEFDIRLRLRAKGVKRKDRVCSSARSLRTLASKEKQAKRDNSGSLLQGLVHQITDPGEPLRSRKCELNSIQKKKACQKE